MLAADKEFTTAEVCAHAAVPKNLRLRAAIVAVCGEVSAKKLGWALKQWKGKDIASLRVDCVGEDPAGLVYRVSATEPCQVCSRANSAAKMATLRSTD